MARTTTAGTMPEFMTSPIAGALLSAELAIALEALDKYLTEAERTRIEAVRRRALSAAMAQLDAYHAAHEGGS